MAAGDLYERVITCKREDLIIVDYSANTITRRCTDSQSSCGVGNLPWCPMLRRRIEVAVASYLSSQSGSSVWQELLALDEEH